MIFESWSHVQSNGYFLNFDNLSSKEVHFNVADEQIQNLSESEKELLYKYRLLGHANLQWVQELI